MKKVLGVLVLASGILSGVILFVAGSSLSKASQDMSEIRSIGGTSVAEAYYQEAGKQGSAYSLALHAAGLAIISVSLGLSGLLLFTDDYKVVTDSEVSELETETVP